MAILHKVDNGVMDICHTNHVDVNSEACTVAFGADLMNIKRVMSNRQSLKLQ